MSTRICPTCGSAHLVCGDEIILTSSGITLDASCLQCGWAGKDTDLLTIPDQLVDKQLDKSGEVISPDRGIKLAAKMSEDLLAKLARNAGQSIGRSLVGAGFVGLRDAQRMAQLIKAACLGAVSGVMAEMEKLQAEAQDGKTKVV